MDQIKQYININNRGFDIKKLLIDEILRIAFNMKQLSDPLKTALPVIKNSASNTYCNSKLRKSVHN